MKSPIINGPELMRQEVLEEARRQKEEILNAARREAEDIVVKARGESERFRKERLDAARAEAARRGDAILATVSVEAGRVRALRIEELLRTIHDQAQERFGTRSGFDFRETVVRLSSGALQQMDGETFRLRLSVQDCQVCGDGLAADIRKLSDHPALVLQILADSTLKDGEVLIEDEAGRQVWNVSLDARLERCWPELRRQIAAQAEFLAKGTA